MTARAKPPTPQAKQAAAKPRGGGRSSRGRPRGGGSRVKRVYDSDDEDYTSDEAPKAKRGGGRGRGRGRGGGAKPAAKKSR